MPTFIIEREIPGASTLTHQEDLVAHLPVHDDRTQHCDAHTCTVDPPVRRVNVTLTRPTPPKPRTDTGPRHNRRANDSHRTDLEGRST